MQEPLNRVKVYAGVEQETMWGKGQDEEASSGVGKR